MIEVIDMDTDTPFYFELSEYPNSPILYCIIHWDNDENKELYEQIKLSLN